jgi:EAL domain-containing protein (putative c-di-GMP-specific phosphodiesterase class I)
MKIALPRVDLVGLARRHMRVLLTQFLLLLVIWGMAIFALGSLDVWARARANTNLQNDLRALLNTTLTTWLQNPAQPLKAVAKDATLREALQLPQGLQSPPVQRALNNLATQLNDFDLTLVDFSDGQLLASPGAAVIAPEVLTRMNALRGADRIAVTAGSRSAMLYVGMRLPAPMPHMIYVVRGASLRALEARMAPDILGDIAATRLHIVLPHTSGRARWTPAAGRKLDLFDDAEISPEEPKLAKGVVPYPLWPDTELELQGTDGISVGTLGAVLIYVWALMASLACVWPYTQALRARISVATRPYFDRVQAMLVGLEAKVSSLLTVSTTGAPKDPPLVNGPGDFSPMDFSARKTSQQRLGHSGFTPGLDALTKGKTPGTEPTTRAGGGPREATPAHTTSATYGGALPPSRAPSPEDIEETRKATLFNRVQRCLATGLLELNYQTIYRVDNAEPFAHEVLARLVDEDGTIMPHEFMPLLPRLGGESILDAAVFRRVVDLHCSAFRKPPTILSLNVSGNSLEDLEYLRNMAQQGPDVLKMLMFEVRSQEIVRDPIALQLLKGLQRQGAKVAVDYFGGGPTMIEATKALGLDFVKIDCTRLSKTTQVKKELLQICLAAQKVKLQIIMEKVEDHVMETFVRRAGANFLQGYGLSRPKPQMSLVPLSARMRQLDVTPA